MLSISRTHQEPIVRHIQTLYRVVSRSTGHIVPAQSVLDDPLPPPNRPALVSIELKCRADPISIPPPLVDR
eukprot:scaffold316801_cov18-Tisochrysis_lutea.AAC.1